MELTVWAKRLTVRLNWQNDHNSDCLANTGYTGWFKEHYFFVEHEDLTIPTWVANQNAGYVLQIFKLFIK